MPVKVPELRSILKIFWKQEDISRAKEKYPSSIVSLKPNITEILFALGAGDKLVGVTRYCNYPEAAKEKPARTYVLPITDGGKSVYVKRSDVRAAFGHRAENIRGTRHLFFRHDGIARMIPPMNGQFLFPL